MTFTEEGLVLGAGTVLAKAIVDPWGRPALAVDGAEERILALLSIAYGKGVDPAILDHIRRASEQWSRGELHLALIHLAYTGLSELTDEQECSFRLFMAARALADGVALRDLLTACGLDTVPLDLLKARFNPNQPRVPKGNPGGGQWSSNGSGARRRDESTRSLLLPAEYTHVREMPHYAKMVIPRDGVPVLDPDSPTKFLMAPARADFREVYAAGRAIAHLPFSEQYARARAAIAQEGTYDFQREVQGQKFYDPYVHAANYAVGVYMAGAGYSLETTLAFAKLYALRHSSNYDAQDQLGWIERGWTDAVRGRWR